MDRILIGRKTRTVRLALALFISPVLVLSQAPAGLRAPALAAKPASTLLQPALDTVRATLDGLRLDKWKKGSIRDEASTNIDSIRNDLRTNMAALMQQADAAPGTISKLLPVSRHLDALYNVLLRVTEGSRISGPDEQAAQLQRALQGLGDARLALGDRIQGSAEALEKQVADLKTTVQQQAAQKAAIPAPVALPCLPPPAKKPTTKTHKRAVKPATTAPANTAMPSKPQ